MARAKSRPKANATTRPKPTARAKPAARAKPSPRGAPVGGNLDPAYAELLRVLATDAELAPAVDALIASKAARLPRRFGSNALRVDGKIFAMWVRGAFVVKLPRTRVAQLVADGEAVHFGASRGVAMKEWASLQPRRTPRSPTPMALAREAYAFVGGSRDDR